MRLRRAHLLKYLPEPEQHANARWLFRTICRLCDDQGRYTGSMAHLRDEAGYSSGPGSAPRTPVLLRQLEQAGLITMDAQRKGGARVLSVHLAKITAEMLAV